MANGIWYGSVCDQFGRGVNQAIVRVTDPETEDLLGLFKDRDGTMPMGNPFLTRENGAIQFYVRAGRITVSAAKGADEKIFPDEIVADDWPPAVAPGVTFTVTVGKTGPSESYHWGYGVTGMSAPFGDPVVPGGAISSTDFGGLVILGVSVITYYDNPTPQSFIVFISGEQTQETFTSAVVDELGTLLTANAFFWYDAGNNRSSWQWNSLEPTGTWEPVGGTKAVILA